MKLKFLAATLILGLASFAGTASARTNVDIGIVLGAPVYYEPAPVVRYESREYYEPRPVYYESRPVYGYYQPSYNFYYRDGGHNRHHHHNRGHDRHVRRDYRRDDRHHHHRDNHRDNRRDDRRGNGNWDRNRGNNDRGYRHQR